MENYIITDWEKEIYWDKYPVLKCPHSIGIDYDDDNYFSVKCKALTATCSYKNSQKDEYKECMVYKRNLKK